MNFKRPSFKRGGSTGIGQLTPRRQGYAGGGNIGGGIISGSNLGTRSGFKYPNFPGFEFLEPAVQNELRSQMKQPKGLTRGSNATRLGLKTLRNFPKTSTAGLMSLPFVLPAGLAYMNKPETLAEKKVMQDYGMIDETFFDYDKMYADREAASKVGDKISFSDALFMDPETGQYPKFFGRTEDRNKEAEVENLRAAETDLEDGITNYENDEAEAAEQKSALDSALDTMIKDTDKDKPKDKGGDKPEPTFEDTYQTEFDRIQKLIGNDDTKGMAAIALSEAIGTPGTIADKAAVLNKSLVALMGNKKKDKKEIAMLAYKATKEIEKAKIVAGKQTDSAKNFEEIKSLNRIIQDKTGTYNEDQKRAAQGQLSIISESIRVLNPQKETGLSAVDSKAIQGLDILATKLARLDKDSAGYKKAYDQYLRARIVVLKNKNLADLVALADAQVGLEFRKDGGRIGFANGSPIEQITETETVETSGTPTVQVTQLSFEELRDRLPPEVTDDVIRFLSQSEQALQDFAYIRTAGDIKKFNMKYGLNLVLPAQA